MNNHVPKEGADIADLIAHRILSEPYNQRNSMTPITAGTINPAKNIVPLRLH